MMGWATVALTLAACSGDHVLPDAPTPPTSDRAIGFGSYVDDERQQSHGTRAVSLSETARTFMVYGHKNMTYDPGTDTYGAAQVVFGGYTVTHAASTAGTSSTNRYGWEYLDEAKNQTPHYWDFAAKAYRFAAYAPADAAVTIGVATDALSLSYEADATSEAGVAATPYYARQWFSDNSPSNQPYGQGVLLKFVRPFSRVRFCLMDSEGRLIGTDNKHFSFIAPPIAFKPRDNTRRIALRGRVNISYPLEGTARKESFTATPSLVYADAVDALTAPYEESVAFAGQARQWYTVLPVGAQGNYTLSLSYNGSTRMAEVPAAYMDWQPGYQYTYVFKMTDTAVVFAPELYVYTKWQAGYADETPATW